MFHLRCSSPVLVTLGGGRQGLRNPTWCGRLRLPEGHRAAHAYALRAELVTCPVCHHLYTCATHDACEVCNHLYTCAIASCRAANHPGILPTPPDPKEDNR